MPPKNLPLYIKPPLSITDQLIQLQTRGMMFSNIPMAEHHLGHLNYYRLSAYWLPYESNHTQHQFHPGTQFDDVINAYIFDRELRLLILDAIERIEVSVRTQMTRALTLNYGSHPHLMPQLFHCPIRYAQTVNKLKSDFDRSDEQFSEHFKNNYAEKLPPLWAAVELMTMGQISNWYANIKARQDRQTIARVYGLDEGILGSFLHHLTIVRNICAHHGRLWNRRFAFTIKIPNHPVKLAQSVQQMPNHKNLYNTLTFLAYMMDVISPGHHWKTRLRNLITNHNIQIASMGFPNGWQSLPVWI
jgi:abortive infection bacteriophage resistance protein